MRAWPSSRWQSLIAFTFLAYGCGFFDDAPAKKNEQGSGGSLPTVSNQAPVASTTQLQCQEGTSLDYGNFGEAFMLTYCTSCHSQHLTSLEERLGAPLLINLDTPDGVTEWRSKIIEVTGAEAPIPMPPSLHVPEGERRLLLEWLQCGAPPGKDSIRGPIALPSL